MDITQYYKQYPPGKAPRILTATFKLTRSEMLDALKGDRLLVNGRV